MDDQGLLNPGVCSEGAGGSWVRERLLADQWDICKHNDIISAQLNKEVSLKVSKEVKCEWTQDAKHTFKKLKSAFSNTPFLRYFEHAELIILLTDSTGVMIMGIPNKDYSFRILRMFNFSFWIWSSAE